MEIHGLSERMITVFCHASAVRTQIVVGSKRTIAGNELHWLTRFKHRLQAVQLIEQFRIDLLGLIGAIVTEKMI